MPGKSIEREVRDVVDLYKKGEQVKAQAAARKVQKEVNGLPPHRREQYAELIRNMLNRLAGQ